LENIDVLRKYYKEEHPVAVLIVYHMKDFDPQIKRQLNYEKIF